MLVSCQLTLREPTIILQVAIILRENSKVGTSSAAKLVDSKVDIIIKAIAIT